MNKYVKFIIEYYRIFGTPEVIYNFIHDEDQANYLFNYEKFCKKKICSTSHSNFEKPDKYICNYNLYGFGDCNSCFFKGTAGCWHKYSSIIAALYKKIVINNNLDLPFELFEKLPKIIKLRDVCNSIEDIYKDSESYFEGLNEHLDSFYKNIHVHF